MRERRNKAIGIMIIIAIILCLAIAAVTGYICLHKIVGDQKSIKEFDNIRDNVITFNDTDDDAKEDEAAPIEVDFEELWEINKDVVAWIYIPCINVSYPVMHTDSNSAYVHTDIYGNYLYAGCLFLDSANLSDFQDPNSIIYGHNMANGTMFGQLWHIVYREAADENPYFWIITPQKAYKYKMFSAFEETSSSTAYTLFNHSLFTTEEKAAFLDWGKAQQAKTYVDFGTHRFVSSDRVVTLSTCRGTGNDGGRTLVMGVCVNDSKEEKQTKTTEQEIVNAD